MERLLQLGPKELQSGIYPGVNKVAVPFWADGVNIVFREQGVQNARGADLLGGSEPAVLALAQARVSPQDRVYAGTGNYVIVYHRTAGVWGSTTIHTWGAPATYVDLETWGAWLLATNGGDPVKIWKNTGSMADLAGVTFTWARILKRKLVFLFAINTSNGENTIEWSDESDVETWVPDPGNRARNMTIRDLDSGLVAAVDLGERLAVYSRNSLVVGTFVGGQNVWGFRTTLTGVGAVSRRSVVAVGPLNYGLNRTGIFMTDGASFQYQDNPDIRRWLRDNVDWSNEHLIWGLHDNTNETIVWTFLDKLSRWSSVIFDYKNRIFSKALLAVTAGIPQEIFDAPVVASAGGGIGAWQGAVYNFGIPVEFNIQSRPLDFGTTGLYKVMQLVKAAGTWDTTVNLRIRAHSDTEDVGEIVFDKPLVKENYLDREAPMFSFELHGTGAMTVNSLEFFGVPGGIAL